MMGFPTKKELDEIRKEAELWEGSMGLPENATPEEKFRYQICEVLVIYCNQGKLKNKDMAKKAQITEADMSRILNYRIETCSTDKLLGVLSKLLPKYEIELKVG